jgi:proteic killer suppression protein
MTLYNSIVIKTIRDIETGLIFQREISRNFPADIQQVALRKLRVPPANRLEKLAGDRTGQHSIRINDQWRICFEWRSGDAYLVEIVDYHH